jgi:hypothetical protein
MKPQWTTWILVAATLLWLLLSGRLDLLLIVVPVAAVISYVSGRSGKVGRNRI